MRDILVLFVHVIITVFRLAKPGGFWSVVAESALVRHQLLILNRGQFGHALLLLPASTERLVELHEALIFVATILGQGEFGAEQ